MTLFKKEAYFHTLAAVSQGTGFYFSTYKQTDWKTLQRPIIQWYEARNKLQEGNHNYVKIKQHATTQPMCSRRNQVRRQKNILRQMKKEIQHSKTYWIQQKQL